MLHLLCRASCNLELLNHLQNAKKERKERLIIKKVKERKKNYNNMKRKLMTAKRQNPIR